MKVLRNASIGTKVAMAPVFAILCVLIVAAVSLWGSLSGTRSLSVIQKARIPGLAVAGEVQQRISDLNAKLNQSLVWEGAGVKAATIATLDKQIATDFKDIGAFIDRQQDNPVWSAQDKETWKQIAAEFSKFTKSAADTLDMKSTGLGSAAGFITRSESSYKQLHTLIGELFKQQQGLIQKMVADAEQLAAGHQISTVATVLVALCLAGFATWWCRRLIVGPLVQASHIASDVAKGNLETPRVEISTDETGKLLWALCELTRSLNSIVGDINSAANDIDKVSGEIGAGNKSLAVRTEQAGAALAQTAAAIEQLTASVQMSAGNAKEAHVLAQEASDFARSGGAIVKEAVTSMENISAQSKQISEIVGVIDSIAFQTNILALNASVEAARAGDLGRGFAVVADEVRTLAQRSATAAKEIRELIGHSVSQIGNGADKVRGAGGAMSRIVESIERVSVVVKEMSSASAEQAAGIEQVSLSISELDRTTQQNASLVHTASGTAQALKAQSQRLMTAISVFRTTKNGGVGGVTAAES